MKRVYSNSDLKIYTDEIDNLGEKFIINFYTTSKEYTIQRTDQDIVIEDNGKTLLKLNWTELATIGKGVLQYVLNNVSDDADYDDGEYDKSYSKTTDYFIVNDIIIDDGGDDQSIREVLAEMQNQINSEITRSTNKDNDHDSAISTLNTDVYGQYGIMDRLQGCEDDYMNLSQRLAMEETARQNGDTQLQNNLDAALATKASTTDVSMLWNSVNSTQTELTNFKSDVEDSERVVAAALNDLEDTKAEQDDLQQLRDEFEYERNARKVDDEALEDRIENLEDNYQPLLTAGTGITITNNVISATGGGGVAQVQSDWEQSDNTQVDYIKNKPYVPTASDMNGKQDVLTNGSVSKIVDVNRNHTLKIVNELDAEVDCIATSSDPYSHWNQGDDHTLATIGLIKTHIPTIPTNVSAFTNDAGYLTQHQSLSGYATESYVQSYVSQQRFAHTTDLDAYQPVLSAGSNINIDNAHNVISADLSNYYTKAEVDAMIADLVAQIQALQQ